jgi:hypothetical protein
MTDMDLVTAFQQGINSVFGGSDWLATAVIALLVSATLSSLAWILSSVFESKELKGWAKKELSEFVFTGIILVSVIPLLTLIATLSVAYVGGDPYSLANDFLTRVENDLLQTYSSVSTMKITYAFISSFKMPLGPIFTLLGLSSLNPATFLGGLVAWLSGLTFPFGAPFYLLIEPLDSLQSAMQPILLAFFVQKELLFIIQKTMLPIVLPLGILLRAFPVTRRAGSTLIAISITAYIIYPITLVVTGGMYDNTLHYLNSIYNMNRDFPSFGSFYGYYIPISPSPGKYYLNESDAFEWQALQNLSYRLWAEKSCSNMGNTYESELISSPSGSYLSSYPPPNYVYWRIKETVEIIPQGCGEPGGSCTPEQVNSYTCYWQVAKGNVNQSNSFKWQLNGIMLKQDDKNKLILMTNYTIPKTVTDDQGHSTTVYETKTLIDNYEFYFGDPCKEDLWSIAYCKLAKADKEDEVKDVRYARLVMLGVKGAFSGLSEFSQNMLLSVGQAGAGSVVGSFLPPVIAGYSFINLTDQLPRLVYSYIIILFNFVIVILVFISSFKSISQTLGGETTIIEIGRLV